MPVTFIIVSSPQIALPVPSIVLTVLGDLAFEGLSAPSTRADRLLSTALPRPPALFSVPCEPLIGAMPLLSQLAHTGQMSLILAAPLRVLALVLVGWDARQVLDAVVGRVMVDMVHLIPRRDRAPLGLPHLNMQCTHTPLSVGLARPEVDAVLPAFRVWVAGKNHAVVDHLLFSHGARLLVHAHRVSAPPTWTSRVSVGPWLLVAISLEWIEP